MTAGWKAKATIDDARRWAAFSRKMQAQGQVLVELQRRTADRAEGLRRLQEAAKRLAGLRGGR
jgi:hypothetical protein